MHYCVENLGEFRKLAKRNQLSMFNDFWAPDHKNIMPVKAAYTPENLMTGKVALLAKFHDPGLTKTKDGEADPMNPPHFWISCELMWRIDRSHPV
jgi:hypothetical protein